MAYRKLAQLNEYELESETGLPIVSTRGQMKRLNTTLRDRNMILREKMHKYQDDQSCRRILEALDILEA